MVAFVLAQSVDDLVSKAIAARGGVKRIKSINSQRLTGKISLRGGASGPFVVEMKRPGMMRETVTLGDKSMIRITDGVTGWVVGSLRNVLDPHRLRLKNCANSPPAPTSKGRSSTIMPKATASNSPARKRSENGWPISWLSP
jgi:hypothetical protein